MESRDSTLSALRSAALDAMTRITLSDQKDALHLSLPPGEGGSGQRPVL